MTALLPIASIRPRVIVGISGASGATAAARSSRSGKDKARRSTNPSAE